MKYIIVCGPTCTGKTGLGISLAERYNGEVINADSRQIYKHTSIGTAKPKPEECRGIKHFLLDFLELDQSYSAYKFAEQAKDCIIDITKRNKLPLVVGGTGLYLKALTEGLFKSPEPDYEYRKKLTAISAEKGSEKLHHMLSEIDPVAASKISVRDELRLIRALEIYKLTGQTISEKQQSGEYTKVGEPLWIGLMPDRKILYKNITDRVDKMINQGFEEEVLQLKPYFDSIKKKKMIGYVDMINYLFEKKISRQQALDKVKQHHRNYAKRQLTWFRKVKTISWFDPFEDVFLEKVYRKCDNFLEKA